MDRSNIEIRFGLNLPSIRDIRTIPLRGILRLPMLPPLPDFHNADEFVGGIKDDRMFGNDIHNNCVLAAQAHYTLRLEKFEQKIQIPITDKEVVDEYFRQSHNMDTGLYLQNAMKEWRNTGWRVGGKIYNIYAFAGIDPLDHKQVEYAVYLFNGLIFGMKVYQTDVDQFKANKPWTLTGHNGVYRGGHGVYSNAYFNFGIIDEYARPSPNDATATVCSKGLWCMTWGESQYMSWDFWDKRVDQAFAIVDDKDKWLGKKSPVDTKKLDAYLKEIGSL